MAKHRRGRSAAATAPTPTTAHTLPLSLSDVFLLTAESNGQEAVPGLTVVVDQDGLMVLAPNGTAVAQLVWSQLSVLKTAGRTRAPEGGEAVLLEVSDMVRTHLFLVPTDDPVGLEGAIAEITGIPPPDLPRKTRKRK